MVTGAMLARTRRRKLFQHHHRDECCRLFFAVVSCLAMLRQQTMAHASEPHTGIGHTMTVDVQAQWPTMDNGLDTIAEARYHPYRHVWYIRFYEHHHVWF